MKRLGVPCLVFLLPFILTGCPKDFLMQICIHRVVEVCPDPPPSDGTTGCSFHSAGFDCYDPRLPDGHQKYLLSSEDPVTDKLICTNSKDMEALLEACEIQQTNTVEDTLSEYNGHLH